MRFTPSTRCTPQVLEHIERLAAQGESTGRIRQSLTSLQPPVRVCNRTISNWRRGIVPGALRERKPEKAFRVEPGYVVPEVDRAWLGRREWMILGPAARPFILASSGGRYKVATYEGRHGRRFLLWFFPSPGAAPVGLFAMRRELRDACQDRGNHRRGARLSRGRLE